MKGENGENKGYTSVSWITLKGESSKRGLMVDSRF